MRKNNQDANEQMGWHSAIKGCQSGSWHKAITLVRPYLFRENQNDKALLIAGIAFIGLNQPLRASLLLEKAHRISDQKSKSVGRSRSSFGQSSNRPSREIKLGKLHRTFRKITIIMRKNF